MVFNIPDVSFFVSFWATNQKSSSCLFHAEILLFDSCYSLHTQPSSKLTVRPCHDLGLEDSFPLKIGYFLGPIGLFSSTNWLFSTTDLWFSTPKWLFPYFPLEMNELTRGSHSLGCFHCILTAGFDDFSAVSTSLFQVLDLAPAALDVCLSVGILFGCPSHEIQDDAPQLVFENHEHPWTI